MVQQATRAAPFCVTPPMVSSRDPEGSGAVSTYSYVGIVCSIRYVDDCTLTRILEVNRCADDEVPRGRRREASIVIFCSRFLTMIHASMLLCCCWSRAQLQTSSVKLMDGPRSPGTPVKLSFTLELCDRSVKTTRSLLCCRLVPDCQAHGITMAFTS